MVILIVINCVMVKAYASSEYYINEFTAIYIHKITNYVRWPSQSNPLYRDKLLLCIFGSYPINFIVFKFIKNIH